MKKAFFLFAAFTFFTASFASSVSSYLPKKATEIYLSIGNNKQISLKELSTIKVKDYEKLSGRHFSFFQRINFKLIQKKLKSSIAPNGTLLNNQFYKHQKNDYSTEFHPGGFALGFFLGIVGVLIAYVLPYIIKRDKEVNRNRIKWAWIGFGVSLLLFFLLILLVITLIPRVY
jgi:hypothetical protein